MAKRRLVRPEKDVFVALCQHHTQREIAEMFGVTTVAVTHWQKLYGCRPIPGRRGARRRLRNGSDRPEESEVEPERTTPVRLSYWAQGGIWA